jgi:GntR family transcriptional regulator/MocR family aminotransferase
MSLERRLALLAFAKRAGAWIFEDDYDSEFRYIGRPIAALQGLDHAASVIYAGTFSKVLFPGLRLGYIVAPPEIVDAFVAARAVADRNSAGIDQAVVTRIIADGHFSRHLRRMRERYEERQHALVAAAGRYLEGLLEVEPRDAGMHLVGQLLRGRDDIAAARRAFEFGVDVTPLSAYYLEQPKSRGLILCYTSAPPAAIREGARKLREALL